MTKDNLLLYFHRIVERHGTPGALADYEKYDLAAVKRAAEVGQNFIFVQYHFGNAVVMADSEYYFEQFKASEACRFAYARDISEYHLSGRPISSKMLYFFVDVRNGMKVRSCCREEANALYGNEVKRAIQHYRLAYPEVWPSKRDLKIRLRFHCSLSYLRAQLKWAEQHGDSSLIDVFHRLKRYAKSSKTDIIEISQGDHDRAFWVRTPSYVGQICYHGYKGEIDRSFSVLINGRDGVKAWSLHT